MLKKTLQTAALAAIAAVSGCATDVDLTGEYAETAVVYGLLDESNNPANGGSGHLIRIQKAFLGDASAVDMALVSDSSYFPYEDLEVNLLEINDDDTTWHLLDTAMVNTKQTTNSSGVVFFGPQQRVYKANVNISGTPATGVTSKKFGLSIKNLKSGYVAYSEQTPLNLATFQWRNPTTPLVPTLQALGLYSSVNNDYTDYAVRFRLAGNVKNHEAWLRFHYRVVSGTDTVFKTLEWRVNSFAQASTVGGEEFTYQINGRSVFSFIGSNITPEEGKTYLLGHRYNNIATGPGAGVGPVAFDLVLKMAGPELSTMLDLIAPSNTSVVTEVPVYSNIDNGVGVFSSRNTKEFKDMYIKLDQVDEYRSGQFTGHIGFRTDQ